MSLLDLIGLNRIFKDGAPVNPTRKILNFVGVGVTVVDNPANERTDITIESGGGGGGEGTLTGPLTSTTGNVATFLGTDGTELDDSGVAISALATEAYVDGAIAAVPGGGNVVGPAGAGADHVATFDGTTGELLKDGGATLAGLLAPLLNALAPCMYSGGMPSPDTLVFANSTWSDLTGAITSGTWVDRVALQISRSGSAYTLAQAGYYHLDLSVPIYVVAASPIVGLRVLQNGVMVRSSMQYDGLHTPSVNNGRLSCNVLCAAGDVLTFQYCLVAGTGEFNIANNQMAGVNPDIMSVEIIRIPSV